MAFTDCKSPDLITECTQLLSSVASFQVYPHERKIRLAVSRLLKLPLNLTLQHGLCNISCGGGQENSCETFTEDHYWKNVNSPFYLENRTPLHYYCISATIADCCPVCTETVFMEDYRPETFSEDSMPWDVCVIAVGLLIIFVGFAAVFSKYFTAAYKTLDHCRFQDTDQVPLRQQSLDLESGVQNIKILCLYIREENELLHNSIRALQALLRSRGLNVVDIYDEEDDINTTSVHRWVQSMLAKETKIIIFDSKLFSSLWNYEIEDGRVLRTVEQTIIYCHSCVTAINIRDQIFIVRFQEMEFNNKVIIDVGNGRYYTYPNNTECLIRDLMADIHLNLRFSQRRDSPMQRETRASLC